MIPAHLIDHPAAVEHGPTNGVIGHQKDIQVIFFMLKACRGANIRFFFLFHGQVELG